jgi:hypothetical protein
MQWWVWNIIVKKTMARNIESESSEKTPVGLVLICAGVFVGISVAEALSPQNMKKLGKEVGSIVRKIRQWAQEDQRQYIQKSGIQMNNFKS